MKLFVLLLLATASVAQSKPPALTADESLSVVVAQKRVLLAQQQLGQSKEWGDLQDAQKELNSRVEAILSAHKEKKYVLCDGPEPRQPACADVAAGVLALRELPGTPAKK